MVFTSMVEVLPPGAQGVAVVLHFEVSEAASSISSLRGGAGYVPPGKYVRLNVDGHMMMSDTRHEKKTNIGLVQAAHGDVFIAGLGIGMILIPILRNPKVTSVTVVEKYQDVVDLVLPAILKHVPEAAAKLTVVVADVLTWTPPKDQKWDVIYFDIWPNIVCDNLAEISFLKRRYAKRKKTGGYMSAWCESELRAEVRRRKAEIARWGM